MLKVMTYINRLLKKFREGNYTNEEFTDLTNLIKIPVYEDAADSSMYMHWKECSNTPVGDEERFKQILNEVHHCINVKSRKLTIIRQMYTGFSRVAAILILPLLATFYLIGLYQNKNDFATLQNTITVPRGAISSFTLADGTEVMLNSGSTLKYPIDFEHSNSRTVLLNGEGYFHVKKDTSKPFYVRMNGIDIKVTGTTFNARAYNDESEMVIALAEGSVLLGKKGDDQKFDTKGRLKPQNVAVYNRITKKMELFENMDLTKYMAWTKGLTIFDNDPIQTVIQKMEKLYNIDVIVHDRELLNYRLTATFTGEPLEQALKIISLSSSINYQIIEQNENSKVDGKRTLILRKRRH